NAYDVRPLQVKWEALHLTVNRGGHYVINPHPVDWAARLFEQAKAEDDYDMAFKIAQTAVRAGNRWKTPGKSEQAVRMEAEAPAANGEFKKIKKHLDARVATPADPAASLEVGRFRCFVQEAWEEGLPLLAQGSDAGLKAAAEKELQDPDTAAGCKQVADAW